MADRYYPSGEDRAWLEMRIVYSIINKEQFSRVSFLRVEDFKFEETKKDFEVLKSVGGNYTQAIRKRMSLLDKNYALPDFLLLPQNALLLVECNMSNAIANLLETLGYEAKSEDEGKFLMEAALEARRADALKLHLSILRYVEPMASREAYFKVKKLVDRISKRITEIKKHGVK